MEDFQQGDEVIGNLIQWAEQCDDIRAMLLTSTRAIPGGHVDVLSDYDVILVVRDIRPFHADRTWLDTFGEVLVAYWDPIHRDPDSGHDRAGNVVQYTRKLKIDFGLWPIGLLEWTAQQSALPAELDAGYLILLDKDDLTRSMRKPTWTGYIPSPPDEATYQNCVNDFFIGVPYVAKCLLRDEVLPAKWCLDYDMRYVYLLPMLEWRMECDNDWSVSPGINGKGLKHRLPPATWAELEGTYAGAEIEGNWESLFRMVALFRRVASEVGTHLGYTYPIELDSRVTAHAHWMRESGILSRESDSSS